MHLFLSYAKSHIYDIHAMVVAVITIIMMLGIKRPIKRYNERRVEDIIAREPKQAEKYELYLKHKNIVLIPITMILACFLFYLASIVSPMIHFSVESAVMSGVFALTGYAILKQLK